MHHRLNSKEDMKKEGLPLFFRLMEWYGLHLHHRGQWAIHNKLQNLFKLNVNKEFHVLRSGAEWVLNLNDLVHRDLFWFGIKDMWETWHIKKILKAGDVIFDIGANFGYYSIVMALLLKSDCSIYAFEPCPPTYARLMKHIKLNELNNCIKSFQLALGDREENKGTLSIKEVNSGSTYIITDGKGDIELTTLDSFCSSNKIMKIDFIKLDVEGFELFVLKGAKNTLSYFKPVILLELNPPTLARNNVGVKDAADFLLSYGYSLFTAQRKRLVPLVQLPGGDDLVNVFAFPKM